MSHKILYKFASLILAFAISIAGFTPAAAEPLPKVAVYAADEPEYVNEVITKLIATGLYSQVDNLSPVCCGLDPTPTLATLQQYAAVMVWSDYLFNDSTALGDVLADYVDAGGHVVVSSFALGDQSESYIAGRFDAQGYLPLTRGFSTCCSQVFLVADLPSNPLLAGVNSFDSGSGGHRNYSVSLVPGATLVAHWTDGQPLVAYKGNVVALNFFPPSSDSIPSFWNSATDGVRLMTNALSFSPPLVVPPGNDDFASAEVISSLPFNTTVDITDATNESVEPQSCYYSPNTVWYSFTPTVNAIVRADTAGSSFGDTILNIYQDGGSGIGSLGFLQCAYYGNSATFSIQAGVTYYLQAGSINNGGSNLHVNLVEIPRPVNDDFVNATPTSSLPSSIDFENTSATFESNEPIPSCAYTSQPYNTVWFAFTPTLDETVSTNANNYNFSPFWAVYSGSSLNNLTELGCRYFDRLSFQAIAGHTYYIQVGGLYGSHGTGALSLEVTPLPQANFYFYPGDPSRFDTIQFQDSSYEPGNIGIQTYQWNFGDGAVASGSSPSHKYAADGDYQVIHTVTTIDGRTASITQTVQIRTHDVAITKITAPNSANVGQTKTITVNLRNIAYPETVQVDLYKSTPSGFVWVATLTKSVPALSGNRTTAFNFNYIFTNDDAKIGKVTFRAVATIVSARDAWPSDNEAISLQTKVAK